MSRFIVSMARNKDNAEWDAEFSCVIWAKGRIDAALTAEAKHGMFYAVHIKEARNEFRGAWITKN